MNRAERRAAGVHLRHTKATERVHGACAAWAGEEESLVEARQRTHDTLIGMMGRRRAGPVSWGTWSGDAALRQVDRLAASPDTAAELLAYYAELRQKLADEGGFLVIAEALAR